jgi:ribosomal protein S18 acetylase RimI-like enzyme
VRIEELDPQRLDDAVALVARRQEGPDTYVPYLSSAPQAIATELADLEPDGLRGTLTAVDRGGMLIGLLGAEHSHDPPRVWWHGPYVDDHPDPDPVVDRLYEEARRRLPPHVTQEEIACDDRSGFLPAFARRHGFVPEEASVLLERSLGSVGAPTEADDDVDVRVPSGEERMAAARLHDELFPGTHSSGEHALRTDRDRVAVVAVVDREVVGYVVADVQDDGGYLDFVGVAEPLRGRGIAERMVRGACRILGEEHRCAKVDLTVRVSNTAARRLYGRLGFAEVRCLQPWRKGFTLGG